MLFMVIENFKNGDPHSVGERFRRKGRMLPDGVVYHGSWVDASGLRCFQVMEAPDQESLNSWSRHWNDLIDFQVIPVMTSSDYWTTLRQS
jgi:Protein of unknown function (DUF3303)